MGVYADIREGSLEGHQMIESGVVENGDFSLLLVASSEQS